MRRLWSWIAGLANRSWRLLLMALVSMTAGLWTWSASDGLKPTWAVRRQADVVIPIGFTDADLLVTCEATKGLGSALVIRHAANGEVTDRFDLGDMVAQYGKLSDDQESIVLTASMPDESSHTFSTKIVVFSKSNGKLRGPPIPISTEWKLSPKGRYMVVGRYRGGMTLNANFTPGRSIIDVATGVEIPLESKVQVRFSPDEDRYITFGGTNHPIVFHAMPDGAIIAQTVLPLQFDGPLSLASWREDRIELVRTKETPKPPVRFVPTISYRVVGVNLVDMQEGNYEIKRPLGGNVELWDPDSVFRSLIRSWNQLCPKFQFVLRRQGWQQRDRVTQQPVGEKIDVEGTRFQIVSESGRWFAAGGDQLSVWSLPAQQNSWRAVAALLAAAAPWGWWTWRIRRRSKGTTITPTMPNPAS